ncbi:MAG: hypothetical protein ACYTEK_15450 [Planctomycetota bacterium]|jgi:small-conductance mechanosensitive channel
MKLDRPTIIGFKYVGVGIFAYVIALLVISAVFKYSNTCAISASIAVMSAMVISAAREGYMAGKRTPLSASEPK